ncbi:MAG: hypothetical protein V1787_01175 [Candidatus Micrarchaeota archaeon]
MGLIEDVVGKEIEDYFTGLIYSFAALVVLIALVRLSGSNLDKLPNIKPLIMDPWANRDTLGVIWVLFGLIFGKAKRENSRGKR